MRVTLLLLTTVFAVAPTAVAVAPPTTTVVVETFHEGVGAGPKLTITVPIGSVYQNKEAFHAVSALYILGDDDTTSCIPYESERGFGAHGNPFTFGHPARFSKNMAAVGSLVCTRD